MNVRLENAEYIRTTALYLAVGEAIAKRAIAAGWIGQPLVKHHNFVVWRPDAPIIIRTRIAKGDYPPPLISEVRNREKWNKLRSESHSGQRRKKEKPLA